MIESFFFIIYLFIYCFKIRKDNQNPYHAPVLFELIEITRPPSECLFCVASSKVRLGRRGAVSGRPVNGTAYTDVLLVYCVCGDGTGP